MLTIQSDRLRVIVAEPGEAPNTYPRFDRTGFVTEVILDGSMTFCAGEPKNLSHPYTGGRGLCCEYTADYSSLVPDGSYYPKWGVGLIKKDGPYAFFGRYEFEPFPTEVTAKKDQLCFTTQAKECMGYALRTVKTLTVTETMLTMEVTAENVGSKPIVTGEYCHNFISIDGMAVDSSYRVLLPVNHLGKDEQLSNAYENPCNFVLQSGGVGIRRRDREVSMTDIPMERVILRRPFIWEIAHRDTGICVRGEDELTPSGIRLWSVDHMISPEISQTLEIASGSCAAWKRRWIFAAPRAATA